MLLPLLLLEQILPLTYIGAERTRTYSKTHITWSLSSQSIGASRADIQKTCHVSATYFCVTSPQTWKTTTSNFCVLDLFTELLPGNALIKSVTICWCKCCRFLLLKSALRSHFGMFNIGPMLPSKDMWLLKQINDGSGYSLWYFTRRKTIQWPITGDVLFCSHTSQITTVIKSQ
jgi:hypothetical protein